MTEKALREQIHLDTNTGLEPLWQGSRITLMLNQAQNWLQTKLIKQGFMNWRNQNVVGSVTPSSIFGIATAKITIPVDVLRDMPMKHFLPTDGTATILKPAVEVGLDNFYFIYNNPVSAPSIVYPIVVIVDKVIHITPFDDHTSVTFTATMKITDLVYDNDSTNSEIPEELQWILVERVVMQIKSIQGNEQVKQAKIAEIDKELTVKYQLDALKQEDKEDRSQPQ